jgi:DNA-binding NarL/FixJ family response regulator
MREVKAEAKRQQRMKSKLSDTYSPTRKARGKKLEEPSSTTAKRVFIVEDHAILRDTLVRVVKCEKDLTVCAEASEVGQAFKAIGRVKPDLVLVDMTLPDASGLELVKELRAMDRKIKLLVVSMHDAALYADRALQAGASGYIRKQGHPEELIHAIREVLDGRIYVSEDVG